MRIGPGVFGPGVLGTAMCGRTPGAAWTPAAVLATAGGFPLHRGAELGPADLVGRVVDLAAGLAGPLRSWTGRLLRTVARDVVAVLRSRGPAVVTLLTTPRGWPLTAHPSVVEAQRRAGPAGPTVAPTPPAGVPQAFPPAVPEPVPLVPAPRASGDDTVGAADPAATDGRVDGRGVVDRHELELPADPTAPGRARALLQDAARGWGLDDELHQDAAMVVTELVANAVDHARTPSTLHLELDDGRDGRALRVAVRDTRPGRALRALPVDPAAARGRGLQMIEALAASWGVTPDDDGKTVWAVLRGD